MVDSDPPKKVPEYTATYHVQEEELSQDFITHKEKQENFKNKKPIEVFQSFLSETKSFLVWQIKKLSNSFEKNWIAENRNSPFEEGCFYAARIVLVLTNFFSQWILFYSLFSSFKSASPFRWLLLIICGAVVILTLLYFIYGWSLAILKAPWVGLVFVLLMHLLISKSTDTSLVSFIGKNLAEMMNLFFLWFLILELVLWICISKRLFLLRYTLASFSFLFIIALATNLISGVNFQLAWLGAGFFEKIPFFFLQPQFLMLNFYIPLCLVSSLIDSVAFRKSSKDPLWTDLNAISSFLLLCMSVLIMNAHGVPGLNRLVLNRDAGIAYARLEIPDHEVEIKTINYDLFKDKDTVDRYQVSLEKTNFQGNQMVISMKVTNLDGFPIFFLDQNQFRLIVNKQGIKQWKLVSKGAGLHFYYELSYPLDVVSSFPEVQEEQIVGPDENFSLEVPMEGDFFDSKLSYYINIPDQMKDWKFALFVDGQLLDEKQGAVYGSLDLSFLPEGQHFFEVKTTSSNGDELIKKVNLTKGMHPTISFVRPSLGEYLNVVSPIELLVSGDGIKQVDLYANGNLIEHWQNKPFETHLNLSPFKTNLILLKARVLDQNASSFSQWVLAKPGMGKLWMNYLDPYHKNVFLILDGSVSELDYWNGKPKWEWQKEIFKRPELAEVFQKMGVGLGAIGTRYAHEVSQCKDFRLFNPITIYDPVEIEERMKNVSPKGISSLFYGLSEALKRKPEKIILITDGADTCEKGLPFLLKKEIGASSVIVDVISLGDISEKKQLTELAGISQGEYISVSKPEELYTQILKSLKRYYHLYAENQLVETHPLDGQSVELRTGQYDFKMRLGENIMQTSVEIKNGLITRIDYEQTLGFTHSYLPLSN